MYEYYKQHDHVRVVPPAAVLIPHEDKTPYQFIETVGRTCYKSEDNMTPESAVSFVQGLVNRKHYAMLEHHWIHLVYGCNADRFHTALREFSEYANRCDGGYDLLKFWAVTAGLSDTYVTLSLRVALELQDFILTWGPKSVPVFADTLVSCVARAFPEVFCYAPSDDGVWKILPEKDFKKCLWGDYAVQSAHAYEYEVMKHLPHTVLFTCDRGVSHELVRHRVASFGQESTRYCNYSQAKFGNSITVIKPFFFNRLENTKDNIIYDNSNFSEWLLAMEYSAKKYFKLLDMGATPQEARSVLPNSLKTEIFITAAESEWQHITNLRFVGTTGAPHPQMKEVMTLAYPRIHEASEGRVKVRVAE